MTKHAFLTGGNGFVGAGVLHHLLLTTDFTFTLPTTGFHKGTQQRLSHVIGQVPGAGERVNVVRCDLSQPFQHSLFGGPKPDYILSIASDSHVDRSLTHPVPFVENNVKIALCIQEYAREVKPSLVLHMSTDETMGDAHPSTPHKEWAPMRPSNPYAASKAAQEAILYSAWRAFGIPLIITNTMNLIAPPSFTYQDAEKYVPMVVKRVLNDEEVTVHVGPDGESGSRFWIDVRDFASAWKFILDKFEAGEIADVNYYPTTPEVHPRFNIAGRWATNRQVAEVIAQELERPDARLVDVDYHGQRPGHDPHYALDATKLKELGWEPAISVQESLRDIVKDYSENPGFLI